MDDYAADYADSLRKHYYGLCVGVQQHGEKEQVEFLQGVSDFYGNCNCAFYPCGNRSWSVYRVCSQQQLLLWITGVIKELCSFPVPVCQGQHVPWHMLYYGRIRGKKEREKSNTESRVQG